MSRTLVGFVTFGLLPFSILTYKAIKETTDNLDVIIVRGKPNDNETLQWLNQEQIPHIVHNENLGFPYSLNDIYDYAWKQNNYDNLIIVGNDVIAYPNAINSLIYAADTTDNDWLCSQEYTVRNLIQDHPEVKHMFSGSDLVFSSFNERPWELFTGWNKDFALDRGGGMSDTHNLALYKKSFFDKIGYIDVSYYPAYYSDNDMARRAILARTKSDKVLNSYYFHFWSRTIKQGSGGSTNKYFEANRSFYIEKWGGDFGKETFEIPFNGRTKTINGIQLSNSYKIDSRIGEHQIIDFWRR